MNMAEHCTAEPTRFDLAVGQNQWSHFGAGAPPILDPIVVGIGMFTGGTMWILTHGHLADRTRARLVNSTHRLLPMARGAAEPCRRRLRCSLGWRAAAQAPAPVPWDLWGSLLKPSILGCPNWHFCLEM